jgi:CheY-like chemotaxis protein
MQPGSSVRPGPSVRPAVVMALAKPVVLVVDDDEMVRRALVRALRRKYAVTELRDAESALALIAGGSRFDAILCDLNLCGMSGRDFYQALDAIDDEQSRRVILLSGNPMAIDDERFGELRPHFLEKPASIAKIDAMITALSSQAIRAA